MPDLDIIGLTKHFGTTAALDDVTVHATDGELLTLLGPSGCGKSTTLWSIAGLHRPDAGTITVGGTTFYDSATKTNLAPEARNCGVVFQSYAVWPHMTVGENVGYPLKLRRVKGAARKQRVDEVLELVEMGEYASRYPHELSGGQQQRVALARALAHPPELLLLDEPFSNLDAKLRERARVWLRHLQRTLGVTTVFVTHDQDEALSMSDRIVVMQRGVVHQIGTPEDIYKRPSNLFVADFIGTINMLDGIVVDADGSVATVRLEGLDEPIRVRTAQRSTGPVKLAVRPEAVLVRDIAGTGLNTIDATVSDRSFLGDHYRYWLKIGSSTLIVQTDRADDSGQMTITIPDDAIQIFDDTTGPL